MSDSSTKSTRTVTVEFLRKGPPHNQLLSPLTEYLGICGDAGAGSVSVPYEQAAFNAILDDLRYVDLDEQDQAPRQRALRTLGRDIGEMLGSVPGFTGSLVEHGCSDSPINLRIVASASELARLPFELAKMPSGTGRSTNDWLALQAATPICVTRRSRTVPTQCAFWRDDARPRVLFIVGLDIEEQLARQHREALMDAFAPWDTFKVDAEVYSEHCLVEMGPYRGKRPTVTAIRDELASGYSYVHILAHGAESREAEAIAYGLYLPGAPSSPPGGPRPGGSESVDVVTGDRFASLLSAIPRSKWPSVVVTATCESAYQGDVLVPGGSFALSLHEAGVPLVIASQFPLTTDGSVTLTRALYEDLAWGKEPLATLMRARAKLHADFAGSHDWASIVVYDGTPDDLPARTLACRYQRAKQALKRSQDALLDRSNSGWAPSIAGKAPKLPSIELAERAIKELPALGGYEREREGLIASHAKLLAEVRYLEGTAAAEPDKRRLFVQARAYLEEARRHYYRAARAFLDPGHVKQLQATLHWVLTQAMSLDRVLGDSGADLGWGEQHTLAFEKSAEEQAWDIAFQSATVAAQGGIDDLWGHGTLAELWLLKLFEDLSPSGTTLAKALARQHALRMAQLSDPTDPFPIFSTKRQIRRYSELWSEQFRHDLNLIPLDLQRSQRWNTVRQTAKELLEILSRFDPDRKD